MSSSTPNLALTKPDDLEQYNIDVFNGNADIIDAAVKADRDRLDVIEAGAWQDCSGEVSVRTDTGGAAAAGSGITYARYRKVGKTVTYMGEGSTANVVANASVLLPPSAGVPLRRYLHCGTLFVWAAASAPADQTGMARMTASKDRIVVTAATGGFRDSPAGGTITWCIEYEVV